MDLDFKSNLKKSVDKFKPDSFLIMKPNGGDVVVGSGGNSDTLYFDLQLSSVKNRTTVWKSRLGYRFLTADMFSDDKASGKKLGNELYDRLITDNILKECKLTNIKKAND